MSWLYRGLGLMLSFFDSTFGSYAIALLFYALIFKIVFLPFSIKQQKNQIKMAKLTPKISLIRAKYKGRTDQASMQKQQQEILELQQKEGYSPFSGCLPLLIQLPIIMLLYAVIQNPISYIAKTTEALDNYNDNHEVVESYLEEYYGDVIEAGEDIEFEDIVDELKKLVPTGTDKDGNPTYAEDEIALISQLTKYVKNEDGTINEDKVKAIEEYGIRFDSIPNFELFGVNLAETPSFKNFSILVLIPILAAAFSWLSMFLTRKFNSSGMVSAQDQQTQASMKIMDLVMPLMTLFIAFNFSGMLGLYWIFQSLLGLLQSFILSKAMPLPQFTEEDIKNMRKAEREAEKAAKAAIKAQPKHRSLHYIDEDDYDELPDAPKSKENEDKKQKGFSSDAPEIKD